MKLAQKILKENKLTLLVITKLKAVTLDFILFPGFKFNVYCKFTV